MGRDVLIVHGELQPFLTAAELGAAVYRDFGDVARLMPVRGVGTTDLRVELAFEGEPPFQITHFADDGMLSIDGQPEQNARMTAWVRSLVPADRELFAVDESWSEHLALRPGITVDEIGRPWTDGPPPLPEPDPSVRAEPGDPTSSLRRHPSFIAPEHFDVIGSALARVAPRGWTSVQLTVVAVGPETRSRLGFRMTDGSVRKADAPTPREVTDRLRDLREAAYRPGLGTWFTATVVVDATGGVRIALDHDNPPPLEPAPNSWAAEIARFPRLPQLTPDWLTQRATAPTAWLGARWQAELRPVGVASPFATPLDATTTPEGHRWAVTVLDRLRAAGISARLEQDDGEDGHGNPTTYDQLAITVGEGHGVGVLA